MNKSEKAIWLSAWNSYGPTQYAYFENTFVMCNILTLDIKLNSDSEQYESELKWWMIMTSSIIYTYNW